MDREKAKFIENLKSAYGIITVACEMSQISRKRYYGWRSGDREFAEAVDDVMEIQGDFVESKLIRLIDQGDTTATIFYCKTKLKKRGYSEKISLSAEPPRQTIEVAAEEPKQLPQRERPDDMSKRIKAKKAYIVKLLKAQGKYTNELSMQCGIAAQLLVKVDMLATEIFGSGHNPVNVETSREGNVRESVNVKEKLYLDYVQQAQRALRSLGMNTDSKERKSDGDGFSAFLNQIGEGEK